MQRIRPEGSRHEVGGWTAGSRQARGGAKHKPVVGRCEDKPGVAMRNIGEFTRCCLDGILIKIG